MKKTYLLLISLFLFGGAGASLHPSAVSTNCVPPTLEEIHLDLLMGHVPKKPRSVAALPVSAWYNVTDRCVIVEPESYLGVLTVCVEDGTGNVITSQIVESKEGCFTVDLKSFVDGFYRLTIQGGDVEIFLIAGRFEIH